MNNSQLPYKNHFEKKKLIENGDLSLVKNVEHFLESAERKKELNCFNFLFEDVIDTAKNVEQKIISGRSGKLAGMVIAVKDVLAMNDQPLTCSSAILKNFESKYTATSVQKLIDEDALIIGKTNCDEFAMGSSNENSYFGNVLNPNDKTRVPGGSSGGSAAAVAAYLCDASLGTDTGGSIRQPASFCGVIGLKPTYGRVSRFGLTAFASSFDSIGPFTRSVEDASLLLEVMAGKDQKDSTSSDRKTETYSENLSLNKKFKIGLPQEYFGEGLDNEIRAGLDEQINFLKAAGHQIINVSLPHSEFTIAAYYILTTAEASSNLARYDGVRYSERAEQISDLEEMYLFTRTKGFGDEVKRRIMLGTYVLSAGYYDAYYRKAQKVRRLIKQDFDKAFKSVDLLLTPTSPTTAFKIGENIDDPLKMYLNDIYTTSANLAGIPGISFPVAADSKGLPIGVQFLADQFDELKLFELGAFLQKENRILQL